MEGPAIKFKVEILPCGSKSIANGLLFLNTKHKIYILWITSNQHNFFITQWILIIFSVPKSSNLVVLDDTDGF